MLAFPASCSFPPVTKSTIAVKESFFAKKSKRDWRLAKKPHTLNLLDDSDLNIRQ